MVGARSNRSKGGADRRRQAQRSRSHPPSEHGGRRKAAIRRVHARNDQRAEIRALRGRLLLLQIGSAGFCKVLQGSARFYLVLLGSTWFYLVRRGSTWFGEPCRTS